MTERSWEDIMGDVKDGRYGDWHDLRWQATDEILRRFEEDGIEDQGISSSDINHVLIGMIRCGDIKPVDA